MNFLEIPGWYEDLPEPVKAEIKQLCTQARVNVDGARLVPESHGSRITAQLHAAKKRFLECRHPFCMIRISDSELGVLGAGFLPPTGSSPIEWYVNRGDFTKSVLPLRKVFIEAIQGAELVGVQQNWKPITDASVILLRMLGISIPMSNAVEIHLPYQLLVDGDLLRSLEGKRVLLIGGLATNLAKAWNTPSFRAAYKTWGDLDKTTIADVFQTHTKSQGGAVQDYGPLCERMLRAKFDVALLSCGVMAKPLAWKIRESGRTALDVGFVFDALLGGTERHARPVSRDATWPQKTW